MKHNKWDENVQWEALYIYESVEGKSTEISVLWTVELPVNLDKSVSESEPSDLSSTGFWGMTETFYFESQLDYKMMQPLKFKQLTHCAIRTLKYILIHRQIHRQMKCGVYKQWNIIQQLKES